jgi:glycosyltransferase involved in cell wall biosynthesis
MTMLDTTVQLHTDSGASAVRPFTVMYVLLDEKVSGVPIAILRTAAALDRQAFRPLVVIPRGKDRRYAGMLAEAGIQALELPLRRIRATYDPRPQLAWLANLPSAVASLRKAIKRHGVNIVHTFGLTQVSGPIAARLEGKPVVWQFMDAGEPAFVKRLFLPLMYRMPARLVVASGGWAKEYLGPAAVDDPRIAVLHGSVDPHSFRPGLPVAAQQAEFDMQPGEFWVCQVGNIHPIKGQHILVEAIHLARQRSGRRIRALIVGRMHELQQRYADNLHAQIESFGLRGEVIMTGQRRDIPEILNAVDLVVTPSFTESFGIAAAEAMACGRAVVASRVGGLPDVVAEGETGLLVPANDASALAEAIIKLAGDADLRKQMGEAGRRRAERLFAPGVIGAAHEALYRQVLAQRDR